jgi:hypothetical protein
MTITSIGSSFSYIRPEAAARETAAAAANEERNETAGSRSEPAERETAASSPRATGSAKASVADELRALMVKTQETHATPPSPQAAARAYGGR